MVGQFIVDEDRGEVYHIPVDKNLSTQNRFIVVEVIKVKQDE